MFKFVLKNKKGYTLIELIVSIAIITIISGVFFANFRNTGNRADVRMAAQKIASDIRMVQNYALSLKEYNSYGVPAGGWGVRFSRVNGNENDRMIIFADRENNTGVCPNNAGSTGVCKYRSDEDGGPNEERFSEVVFSDNIKVSGFNINGDTARNYAYIVFLPPDPRIYISGHNNDGNNNINPRNVDWVEIYFVNENDTTATSVIRINKFGLVDVE